MSDLLTALRRFDALRDGEAGGDIVNRCSLESIKPAYARDSMIEALGRPLRAALKTRGIERLYQHQSDSIEQAPNGVFRSGLRVPIASP